MLYRLPEAATQENWLYECLLLALTMGFESHDSGQPVAPWPDFFPEAHRDKLKKRKKFGDAVAGVIGGYGALNQEDRVVIREALDDQAHLGDLFDGGRSARTRNSLPEPMQTLLADLADRAFDTLDHLGIRGRSYAVHAAVGGLTCTFCGYEASDSSRVRQMDWDHYLARSLYPFASANLRNLSPMGDACNRSFKGSKDILRSNGGARRRCFDPYIAEPATVHVLHSVLFARGPGNSLPEWAVTINGDPDACASWDSVFRLRERWAARLDDVHRACVKFFGATMKRNAAPTDAEIVDRLADYAHGHAAEGSMSDSLLRRAIFELWAERCAIPGQEALHLTRILRGSVAQLGRD